MNRTHDEDDALRTGRVLLSSPQNARVAHTVRDAIDTSPRHETLAGAR